MAATPDEVWAIVSDPCVIGTLSDTLLVDELEPGPKPGVGAQVPRAAPGRPVPVGGNVEIIEFNPPRDMAWTTLTGVDHRLRIRLRDRSEGGIWLSVRFAYDSPGLLGRRRRCRVVPDRAERDPRLAPADGGTRRGRRAWARVLGSHAWVRESSSSAVTPAA